MTDELRKMAEAATPGPWEQDGPDVIRRLHPLNHIRVCICAHTEDDAAFIRQAAGGGVGEHRLR